MAIAQRQDRKDQVLQTAAKLFSERGYYGTSMQDLARDLGILRGSIYAHIDSKEDILFEIVDAGATRFVERMKAVQQAAGPPTEKLRAAIDAHVTTVAEHLDASTVFLNDWRHLSPRPRKKIERKRDQYESLVVAIIAEGVRLGAFRKDLDVRFAALLILSTVNWVYQWFDPAGPMTATQVADVFSEMILKGFLAPTQERPTNRRKR